MTDEQRQLELRIIEHVRMWATCQPQSPREWDGMDETRRQRALNDAAGLWGTMSELLPRLDAAKLAGFTPSQVEDIVR